MLVGRRQKITNNGSVRKAKKRPHGILILTGGRADRALQPPHSRNLPIERLRRVSKDQRICSSLATLSPACSLSACEAHKTPESGRRAFDRSRPNSTEF